MSPIWKEDGLHSEEERENSLPLPRSFVSRFVTQSREAKRSSSVASSSTTTAYVSSSDSVLSSESEEPESPPYLLSDHIRQLHLKTETLNNRQYWYCDWTNYFVSFNHASCRKEFKRFPKLENVIKDYCQPFATHAELQSMYVGLDSESMPRMGTTEGSGTGSAEPYAVRTTMIYFRPDAKQHLILQAVQDAFVALHPTHYHVIKSTLNEFQGLGAHGTLPLVLVANVITQNTSLERQLLLRFYHAEQLGEFLLERELNEDVEIEMCQDKDWVEQKLKMKSVILDSREEQLMSPPRSQHAKLNAILSEASALVKLVRQRELLPSHPAPGLTQDETAQILQSRCGHRFTSKSVLSNFHQDFRNLFPALSSKDKGILKESHFLMERIWLELEVAKATHNTLVVEPSSRFGMPPCQPKLDRPFCFHLAEVSRHNMLLDLAREMEKGEIILREAVLEYTEFEAYLKRVMLQYYQVQLDNSKHEHTNKFNPNDSSLQIEQTPIAIKKREIGDFPWGEVARLPMDGVAYQVALSSSQAFHPQDSLEMAKEATRKVFEAFCKGDDQDQSKILKQLGRRNMIKVTQQQARVKLLLEKIILLPHTHPHIPMAKKISNQWYELTLKSKTSNIRRSPIPILVFQTKLGGQGCITSHQLILVKGIIRREVFVWDWIDIDLIHTADHSWASIAILVNGKRIDGFSPFSMKPTVIVKMAQTLKGLQE